MKAELFEAIYNLSNGSYLPISGSTMGKTTAKIADKIKEPSGSSADEILSNVAEKAKEMVKDADIPEETKPQVVTQVVYNKMANPSEANFQKAILNTVIENKEEFFNKILEEDCCAGDFAGFTPEHVLGAKKKEQDDGNAATC